MMKPMLEPTQHSQDEYFMHQALQQAEIAERMGEVPVGAVLVYEHKIIAASHNQPIASQDPTAHAEMMVLRQGAKQLNNYRLPGTILYVTLEPCAMCAGALIHARVERLVYATHDPRTGACGSIMNLASHESLNHRLSITTGILTDAAKQQLQAFFKAKR